MTKEAASTSTAGGPPAGGHAQGPARQVVLLYKRHATPDASLLTFLEQQLCRLGLAVFIDRHLTLGVYWAREIERRIGAADAVIPLLSESSIQSELLGFPTGAHDDLVDAFCQGVIWLQQQHWRGRGRSEPPRPLLFSH